MITVFLFFKKWCDYIICSFGVPIFLASVKCFLKGLF